MRLYYKLKSMPVSLLEIPDHLLVKLFEFLNTKEKLKYKQLCKGIKQVSMNPILWNELIITKSPLPLVSYPQKDYFDVMISQWSRLKVISLKYCNNFTAETLRLINNNCNPFFLEELYLDGCDNVTDHVFDCVEYSLEETQLNKQLIDKITNKEEPKPESEDEPAQS